MKTKKILLAFILMLTAFASKAQITGPTTIHCGDQNNYSIPSLGQCSECYTWESTGNISIISSHTNNSVTIQAANNSGSGSLSATYFNKTGCHRFTLPITIECGSSGSDGGCCRPVLESYFICRGWRGGHGAVYLDFTENNCNRNSVSSIDWFLNGAEFSSGPLTGQSLGTTYGGGSPGNIRSNACYRISVSATIHFKNGCPDVNLFEDLSIDSPGDDDGIITHPKNNSIIYPNPTKSEINIKIDENELYKNPILKIYNLETGKEVYNKKILNKIEKINLKNLSNSKKFKAIIYDGNTIIKYSTIIIE